MGILPFQEGQIVPFEKLIAWLEGKTKENNYKENQHKAIIGTFITLENPTQPMITEAVKTGYFEYWKWASTVKDRLFKKYPKIQIRTIEELFQGKGIEYPQMVIDLTFRKAEKVETTKETQLEIEIN